MGSGPSITLGGTTKPPEDVVYRRPKVCDANGENCKCMNLASFGERASKSYGTGSDGQPSSTTAFDTWLTEKSSANVTMVTSKPAITAEYLADFDVIILQDLRTWTFTQTERDALATWVNEGGGLISLNGYENNTDDEVTATNAVIGFTGMSYNGGTHDGSVPMDRCPADAWKQICPLGNSDCSYCWGNTIPILDWDTSHPVSKDIHAIGALMGRSINIGDGTVVARFENKPVAASKDIGSGKFFAWCDEWVTYTSQWSGGKVNLDLKPEQLQYEPCYDSVNGYWRTADHVLQSKQFWYNVIHYVAPPTECDFVINEPEVKIILL
jgi:hypothetical protein